MKPISINEIVTATGGELIGKSNDLVVTVVSTDTRNLGEGSLFVALCGDNFDGHAFAAKAVGNGAECLLLDTLPEDVKDLGVPVILVKNSLYGLQRLAKWYRSKLGIKVVGLTGSNGKTSTKDFTAAILRKAFKVNATEGNLNNHIGLPLSVLSTEEDDEVCVLEMGMNNAGEIAPLCDIAAPDIGIITNVGTAHIENLGSREGIAEEKSALARALPAEGTLVVNAGCDFADYFMERSVSRVLVTGNGRGAIRAENLKIKSSGSSFDLCIDGQDSVPVELGVCGKHMVDNALLAAGAAVVLGMKAASIAAGLNEAVLTSGRLRQFESSGVTIIDDTYNANPDSVIAAIETLTDLPVAAEGRRIVVLGVMAELGIHADPEHKRIGEFAANLGLKVVSVGEQAVKINEGARGLSDTALHFNDTDKAAQWLKEFCKNGDTVLFKGSRMARMENVMNEAFTSN